MIIVGNRLVSPEPCGYSIFYSEQISAVPFLWLVSLISHRVKIRMSETLAIISTANGYYRWYCSGLAPMAFLLSKDVLDGAFSF